HLQVAHTIHNLAALYADQEKSEEAEKQYRRAVKIEERILGPEDSSLAASLNNLALLYKARGDFSSAMPLFQRALRLWLKAKSPENSLAATAMNNMGAVCYAQGKNAEAETLFKKALQIKEETVGGRHPEVATILNNLAEVYDAQGRFAEAASLLERLLDLDIVLLGPEHPDVAKDLGWLGRIAEAETDYGRAESFYQKALTVCESHFGPESAQAAENLLHLARVCKLQERYDEASVFSQRADRIYGLPPETTAGAPAELKPAETPAASSAASRPDKEAASKPCEPLTAAAANATESSARVLEERTTPLKGMVISGPPQELAGLPAALSLYEMAERYAREGNLTEAEKLYEGVLAIEEALPSKHGAALTATLNNLGDIQRALGRTNDAAWIFQRSLAAGLSSLGPDHPYVAAALNNLAAVCADRRKFSEAEKLCEESLRIEESMPNSPELTIIHENLAQLRETNKPA
ncbi:MAG: tetratricopeptide repeat protein, partial [Terriglobia bacterium]